jgi:hypothetical protein
MDGEVPWGCADDRNIARRNSVRGPARHSSRLETRLHLEGSRSTSVPVTGPKPAVVPRQYEPSGPT